MWWAGVLLSVSLLLLSYVALTSVDPILALGAHSCWSNIRLAAEWQAVTNTEAIILWLRCCVVWELQTAALTHVATCPISTVQGRSDHEARAKAFSLWMTQAHPSGPSRPLHSKQILLARPGLFWGSQRGFNSCIRLHRTKFTCDLHLLLQQAGT